MLSLHLVFDDTGSDFKIFGFHYNHGFHDNGVFIWYILIRIIPILLFSIWFLTSKNWWRYIIIFPIFPYASTIYKTLNGGYSNVPQFLLSFACVALPLFFLDKRITKTTNERLVIAPLRNTFYKDYKGLYFRLQEHMMMLYGKIKNYKTDKRVERLYRTKIVIEKEITVFTGQDTLFIDKKIEFVIIGVLIAAPFIYYSYMLIPKQLQLLNFGLFSIGNHDFPDVNTLFWFINIKLCVIIPLCIWFITSVDWWRYALFSPIIVYAYQLWEAMQEDVLKVDETAYLRALPTILILLLFLLLISHLIKYQSRILDVYEDVCNEIDESLKKLKKLDPDMEEKKNRFYGIKGQKVSQQNAKENILSLMVLREELQLELDKLEKT